MTAELPIVTPVRGPSAGPTVALLGGVHGDEYEGVLAAAALARLLAAQLRNGEVRVVAPAHPAAWGACTRRSPIDGADLARTFPGAVDGGPTERVAHAITEGAIRGADLVIDLHSAGSGFEMAFLCGYHGDGPQAVESQQCADAFSARYTWRHEGAPAPGRSLTAAFELGIPAIYVEGRGGLSVRADELSGYVDGVCRVLHRLGMIDVAPPAARRPARVHGDGNTDGGITAPGSGYLVTHRAIGDTVARGEVIARVVDGAAGALADVVAPDAGVVMLLRRDARVAAGDTVCIVAPVEQDS